MLPEGAQALSPGAPCCPLPMPLPLAIMTLTGSAGANTVARSEPSRLRARPTRMAAGTGTRHRHEDRRLSELAERIEACANGDRAALRALMDTEGSRLLGIAIRMLRRRDLAEDAVQECFVSLWRKAHQFDAARGSARGWLTTILRNQCLTMLRKESWEIAEDAGTLERRQDEDIVMEAYGRLDMNSDLRRCLDRLEPRKRVAILQAYVLGYTHGEISGRIQAPLGSVKAWVRRGLSALRECLS